MAFEPKPDRMLGRRAVGALVLALLVGVSGCNTLDLGERHGRYDVPTRTSTDQQPPVRTTTTPDPQGSQASGSRATVPSEGNRSGPPAGFSLGIREVAPGVTETGVHDAERLADAHRFVLFDRSFRVRLNHTVRYPNGSRRTILTTAAVSADRSRYAITRHVFTPSGDQSRVRVRSTGAGIYLAKRGDVPLSRRYDEPGSQTVSARNCTPVTLPDPTFHGTVEGAFDATGTMSVRQSDTAPDRYLITGQGNNSSGVDPTVTAVRNFTVAALVESRGVVRFLRVSYRAHANGTPVAVTTSVRVFDVGTASVAPQPLAGPGVFEVPTGGPSRCG